MSVYWRACQNASLKPLGELRRRFNRRIGIIDLGEIAVAGDQHVNLGRAGERKQILIVRIPRQGDIWPLGVLRPLSDLAEILQKAIYRILAKHILEGRTQKHFLKLPQQQIGDHRLPPSVDRRLKQPPT